MVTGPLDPLPGGPARPEILILPVIQSGECEIGFLPPRPALRHHEAVDEALHDDGAGILLPRPAQIGLERAHHGFEIGRGHDPRVVDGYARVLERVAPALCGHHVRLAPQRLSHVDDAVLEDYGRVAEDEVDGAVDVARFVELALRMDEESVLIPLEPARIEHRQIRGRPERHRLPSLWARRVAEGDAPGYESDAIDS